MARALIALGSNLGDRGANLRAAIDQLSTDSDLRLIARSRWIETGAVGGPAGQPGFLNGAALWETTLEPVALLSRLHEIESRLGRSREVPWGPRPLDLDLLLYDELVLRTRELTLPHPRLAVRRFVLEPAAEVAGFLKHPEFGWTIDRLYEHLRTAPPYLAITGVPNSGKTQLAADVARQTGATLLIADPAVNAAVHRSGSPTAVELEFLRVRARLLASQQFPAGGSWGISDFWLGQSLAYARLSLPEGDQQEVERYCQELQTQVIAPKLTVLVELPADAAVTGSEVAAKRLENELAIAVGRADLGPVFRLTSSDLPAAVAELIAAIAAMR